MNLLMLNLLKQDLESCSSQSFSWECGRKLCPQPHCSEEKTTLKTKSVGMIPEQHFSSSQMIFLETRAKTEIDIPQDHRSVHNNIAATYSPRCTLCILIRKHTQKMPHP